MSKPSRNAFNKHSRFMAIGLVFCLVALLISEFLPEGLVASSGMLLANLAVLVSASIAAYRAFSVKTLSGFCHGIVFVSFALTYPLSGVIHLLRPISEYRGFFDLISDIFIHPDLIGCSTVLSALALSALWFGMNRGGSPAGLRAPIRFSPVLLLTLGFFFLTSGAMANVALFGSIEAVFRGLTAIDHSTDFGDGSARYYFISRWFAWGASLIATYVLLRLKNPKPWKISAATLISAAAALANTFWRGGRSEGLMAVLPLILMTFRLHPVASKQSIRAIGMMLLFYVVSITLLRGRGDIASPITDIFDWHAGRFSMVGLGLEMAGNYGHDWGLTMLAPLLQTLNAPFYLLRLQEPFPVPYAITNLTGLYLLGDHTRTGIVPGSICELLYSFGIVGVPVGYYLLGRMVAFTSRHAEFGGTVGGTMAAFYVITLVCTGIIPGTMTTWVYYLVTLGFPCIFLWALELTGVFGLIRASNCCSRQPSGNTKAGGGLKKQTGFG